MNSIVGQMGKYDHRQHVLSDWLAELEQCFQLGEVNTSKAKITWCQLLIGATGSSILSGLEDEASWETAKDTLLSRLGIGSIKDEAWAALKQLKRGSKEIVELTGEAEKLAKRLHPNDEEAAERHVIDAFLSALDRPLAAEVQKVGVQYHGGSRRSRSKDRKDPRRARRLQDGAINFVGAGANQDPHPGPQECPRANGRSVSFRHPNHCACHLTSRSDGCRSTASYRSATATSYRSTTSIPTCSSLVPGLWGGRAILSATSPSTGKESPSLLFVQRGRALCIALSRPLRPPALATAASARTRSRLSTRTSAGTTCGG